MPSASPDRSAHLKLPSPKPSDPPDVPGDIKALADALDVAVQGGEVTVSLSNQSINGADVTFPHAFASTPFVVVAAADSNYIAGHGDTATASGVRVSLRHRENTAQSGAYKATWIAVGPAA